MKVALLVLVILGSACAGPTLKIANGQEVVPHSIPYQAYIIGYAGQQSWFCAGSLITGRFALTAAHCLVAAESATVRLGAHDVRITEPGSIEIRARNIVIHEAFNQQYFDNDIALLELDGEISPSDTINYVRLPLRGSPAEDHVGAIATVSGWGLLNAQDPSYVLRETSEEVIPNANCFDVYQNINDDEVCLSGDRGNSPCRGDSGAPLIILGQQEGIFSYGNPQCAVGSPSVFERIRPHMAWIQTHSDHRG